jgi:hypothetical protein
MALAKIIAATLLLSAFAADAQTASDPVATIASPLDGNWHFAGDRQKKQYPLISMHLHVEGTQISGHGEIETRCLNAPLSGGGGSASVTGEIAADGTFTLATPAPSRASNQVTIEGRVPVAGAASWTGSYTLQHSSSPTCTMEQAAEFTAVPLAPMNGTFAGGATMMYQALPAPEYRGPMTAHVDFTIEVAQGAMLSHTRRVGPALFYLPLTASITVKGSPCFKKGLAEPSLYSILEGEMAHLRFAMEDGSELTMVTAFTDAGESAISILGAGVREGVCDKQGFVNGTLARR